MDKLDLSAFYLGVYDSLLTKRANSFMDSVANENILPTFDKQRNWQYARTNDGLRLSDGNFVYNYSFPGEFPAEDSRISRLADIPHMDFDKDHVSKGTAQIHRSSPDSVYLTLADGKDNPTFTIQHEDGKNWRYMPSKKFLEKLKTVKPPTAPEMPGVPEPVAQPNESLPIDTASLFKGAEDFIKAAFGSMDATSFSEGLHGAIQAGGDFLSRRAANPVLSALEATGVGMAGNSLLRSISPSYKQKMIMNPKKEIQNSMMVPAAMSLGTTALTNLFK